MSTWTGVRDRPLIAYLIGIPGQYMGGYALVVGHDFEDAVDRLRDHYGEYADSLVGDKPRELASIPSTNDEPGVVWEWDGDY